MIADRAGQKSILNPGYLITLLTVIQAWGQCRIGDKGKKPASCLPACAAPASQLKFAGDVPME
jgi:hypothetical protein